MDKEIRNRETPISTVQKGVVALKIEAMLLEIDFSLYAINDQGIAELSTPTINNITQGSLKKFNGFFAAIIIANNDTKPNVDRRNAISMGEKEESKFLIKKKDPPQIILKSNKIP